MHVRLGNRLCEIPKFIDYCRILELLPFIPLPKGMNGSSSTILQQSMNPYSHSLVHVRISKLQRPRDNENIYSTWGSRYSTVFEVLKYYVNYNNI